MRKIVIANQKGGVGKTTTASVIASYLAQKNCKVLVIDMDPQSNLSILSDVDFDDKNIYNAFRSVVRADNCDLKAYIKSSSKGYDIVCGTLEMSQADLEFSMLNREVILKRLLKSAEQDYDYCIIDTPPTLSIITVNALVAADEVLIPTHASSLGIYGLLQLNKTVQTIKELYNEKLEIAGVLVNMYRNTKNNKNSLMELKEITKKLNIHMYESKIRLATAVEKVQTNSENILLKEKNSNITKDYMLFLSSFI